MIHKITIKISLLLSFLFIILFGTTLNAQEAPYLKGGVHDKDGKPLANVVVASENGKNRTFTDANGEYTLIVNDKSKHIEFSFIGYKSKKVAVEKSEMLDVSLTPDVNNLDEVVELGYSSQRRGDLTGAVSTVSGEELKKSPVMNLSMTFAGRLAGLFTREYYSELSRTGTSLYVRGLSTNRDKGPLVIIDGISSSYNTGETLEYITPSEIESVTILKDASTEALYGIQGANG
ncbi:MAG: carboxypeptidase-like regulatory domain-containing protein, partial [Bacteroidota bacterium]|nr:carboxypeptidase-like regulatory domain-containing protein [Bacteroidota bacterium]